MIKKLALLMLGLMLSLSGHGQGTVTFANSATTLVVTNSSVFVTPAAVGSLTLQLYYMPKTGTNPPLGIIFNPSGLISFNGMEVMGATTSIGPVAGRFSAGTRTTGNDVAGGTAAWLQVIAWNSGFADPQSAVFGGGPVGYSFVWSNPTGNPNGTPATNPQSFVLGVNGFNGIIFPGPEPSTIALGGLGAAALAVVRFWRKRDLKR